MLVLFYYCIQILTVAFNALKAALLELSALTDHAEYMNETLWLVGNRTLLSLNLSSKLTFEFIKAPV